MKTDPTPQATEIASSPWEDVAKVERQIRLVAFTSAGDPSRRDDTKMFAIWSGILQKAINDAKS